jgi:hypothetical protein
MVREILCNHGEGVLCSHEEGGSYVAMEWEVLCYVAMEREVLCSHGEGGTM